MLDKKVADEVIHLALESGADFCDIFVERTLGQTTVIASSDVESVNGGIDFGIGVRVIYGDKALYGYTNSTDRDELLKVTATLCAPDKRSQQHQFKELNFLKPTNLHPCNSGLETDISLEDKIAFLMQIDKAARGTSEKIAQAMVRLLQKKQDVEIFNSHGLHTSDSRHYTRVAAHMVATDGTEQADAFRGPGAMNGWDFTKSINPTEFGEMVASKALTSLTADHCPAGKMPVIIDNGFGGVIFHEACGHLLETTSVQTKSSVFWDKLGEQIAHSAVNAVDDGTMPNAWGSINIDDEGMPTQRTQLIKDGKLTSFMVDYLGEIKTGHKRTGSARRQNYKFAPASRMRNTFIEAGDYKVEELIASVDKGIYAKSMGGGSVKPGTGEFNFAVTEGYLIENGKIGKAVKGATLIGTGPDVLTKISMVGNNFEIDAGMCGSVSGSIPASVGQAALKVDEILVGGKA